MTRGLRNLQPIFRQQTWFLIGALSLPVITDVLYVFGITPIPYYNITPAMFSLTAAIAAWDLFRFHLLDVRPMAREMIVESLQDGIVVLDVKNRIVDFNAAAGKFANLTAGAIGKDPREIQAQFLEALEDLAAQGKSWTEIQVGKNPTLYYELRTSEVRDPAGQSLGRIVTIHDNTERAELFHKIEYAATHDDLTHLLNRQQFTELVEQELRHPSVPANRFSSLLMFDLDGFKGINDHYGHAAGDEALILAARKCQEMLRPSDVVGRIGGDEFAVFLAGADPQSAFSAAERLRSGIEKIEFLHEGEPIAITISIGFDSTSKPGDDFSAMLKRADKAMYRAKQLGGNRIVDYAAFADSIPTPGSKPHGNKHRTQPPKNHP